MKMTIKQLVVFAILMENNRGILDKSPDYIMEKALFCMGDSDPQGLLDMQNHAKYLNYIKLWQLKVDE